MALTNEHLLLLELHSLPLESPRQVREGLPDLRQVRDAQQLQNGVEQVVDRCPSLKRAGSDVRIFQRMGDGSGQSPLPLCQPRTGMLRR
jgi:hypothetical protein